MVTRELLHSAELQKAARVAWTDLCQHLSVKTHQIAEAGTSVSRSGAGPCLDSLFTVYPLFQIIPEVEYKDIVDGVSPSLLEQIKASGTLVVRGVVQEQTVSACKLNLSGLLTFDSCSLGPGVA